MKKSFIISRPELLSWNYKTEDDRLNSELFCMSFDPLYTSDSYMMTGKQ